MKNATAKPAKLGTIWPYGVKIQIIDESGAVLKWKTLATCMWTQNVVQKKLVELFAQHPKAMLWVVNPFGERKGLLANEVSTYKGA